MGWLSNGINGVIECFVVESHFDGCACCHNSLGKVVWEDRNHHVSNCGGSRCLPLESFVCGNNLEVTSSEETVSMTSTSSSGEGGISSGWELITNLECSSIGDGSTVLVEGSLHGGLFGSSDCGGGVIFEVNSTEGTWLGWLAWSSWDNNSWVEHGLEEVSLSGSLIFECLVVSCFLGVICGNSTVVNGGSVVVGSVFSVHLHEVHGSVGSC